MKLGYGQFCPIAKASEVLARPWTPLILRELMAGSASFNAIHRGVPLISRAVLVARLRELEYQGIVERHSRRDGKGRAYRLTTAGNALRPIVGALGQWGLAHARDRIRPTDLDPTILLWGLRKRAILTALPDRRIIMRFEFAGVPAARTKFRVLWLILERSGADVCLKEPGFPVDVVFRGKIADFVAVFLGHLMWRDARDKKIIVEGDRVLARQAPAWLRFDQVVGKDFPIVPAVA